MTKKVHKLSEMDLISELQKSNHLPPPSFPDLKNPPKPYVRLPSDVSEFVTFYNLIPLDLRDADLISCEKLLEFYMVHSGAIRAVKKNPVAFGREAVRAGLVHVRRMICGRRAYFYVINKEHRLWLFESEEGDNENKRVQALFAARKRTWPNVSRFKKSSG